MLNAGGGRVFQRLQERIGDYSRSQREGHARDLCPRKALTSIVLNNEPLLSGPSSMSQVVEIDERDAGLDRRWNADLRVPREETSESVHTEDVAPSTWPVSRTDERTQKTMTLEAVEFFKLLSLITI